MPKPNKAKLAEAAQNKSLDIIKTGDVGRPTKYNDEILPTIESLAKQGYTNKEIIQSLGIGSKTFYDWCNRYPQFQHSLNKYRGLADIQVENALFKSAVGYEYIEEQATQRGVVVQVKKHQAASPTAQIFYLKNRMSERYKDKVETELSLNESISQIAFALKRRAE